MAEKTEDSNCKNHDHSHDHGHSHAHGHHHHSPLKNITEAFFLNFTFTIIEFIGGFLTGSVSILADAIHDLGDTISLGLAFYFEKFSQKKRDNLYSFGYRRFSLLSALFSGAIILAGSLVVLKEAIPRFFTPVEVQSQGMILLAIIGVLFNGWAVFKMSKGTSHNEKMIFWHLMEDALGWICVLIGAFVIHFTKWYWLDPVLAVVLATFVLVNVLKNLRGTFEVLLQRVPRSFDEKKFVTFVAGISGVKGCHDLHVWSIDGENHVLSLHLVLDSSAQRKVSEIKQEIQKFVVGLGKYHTTIETEGSSDECSENCDSDN